MESLVSGTFAGAGSFCCQRCGYVLTLLSGDALSDCPGCGGRDFERASLFGPPRLHPEDETARHGGALAEPPPAGRAGQLAGVRAKLERPGQYLCFEEGGELRAVPLSHEWTRVGRSLAADLRFDDPTVSRRHALIVRQADGVRVLDDRSLNGVFVNGARVEGKVLKDGDEIIVGRYRLSFVEVPAPPGAGPAGGDPASLRTSG